MAGISGHFQLHLIWIAHRSFRSTDVLQCIGSLRVEANIVGNCCKRRRWPRFATLVLVHAVTRIGPALLTLMSLLAPAMACALPASGMTASERACCKQMRGRCGAARMPASHSCCRTNSELHQVDGAQPQSHWRPPDPAIVPGVPVACAALLLPACENGSTPWHYHPPPLSLSAGTTVLRI